MPGGKEMPEKQSKKSLKKEGANMNGFVGVLSRRKMTFLIVCLFILVPGIIGGSLIPDKEVYKAATTFKIGNVADDPVVKGLIKQWFLNYEMINHIIKNLSLDEKPNKIRDLIKIEDIMDTGDIIEVSLKYKDPVIAVEILKRLTGNVMSELDKIYGREEAFILSRIDGLQRRKKKVIESVERLNNRIVAIDTQKEVDFNINYVLFQDSMMNKYDSLVKSLDDQIDAYEMKLLNAYDFKVLDPPFISDHYSIPRKKIIIGIFSVLSVILGIFAMSLREYIINKNR